MRTWLQGKKLLLMGLILVMGLAVVAKPIWARDPAPMVSCFPTERGCSPLTNTRPVRYYGEVFEPAIQSQDVNLQSTVYEIFLSLLSSINKSAFRCNAQCAATIGADAGTGQPLADRPTGLIPWLASANVAFLARPPVSSVDYLAHVGEKLHLVSPAYAQAGAVGFGYEGLAPARKIWTAFRNIAYLIATIGFVILAFLVMFRIKVSAQTVIGAQQAIVKLIVVFLAVTFSYAIAGLIVDLLFLLSFVIIALFVSTGLTPGLNAGQLQTQLFSGNIFTQLGPLITGSGGVAQQGGEAINRIVQSLVANIFGGLGAFGEYAANFFGETFDLIGIAIIGIAIIFALFKLLFQLLLTFLEILILTILAPLMILPDILPGGGAFMGWVRRLFANAMVFPATTFMLLLGRAITGAQFDASGNLIGTGSPFSGGLQLPFIGLQSDEITPLLGVGMILLTPKVVDMVKSALKVSAFQYTTAIGAALGAGVAGAGAIGSAGISPIAMPAGFAYRTARDQATAGIRAIARERTARYASRIPGVGRVFSRGHAVQKQQQSLKQGAELVPGSGLDESLD